MKNTALLQCTPLMCAFVIFCCVFFFHLCRNLQGFIRINSTRLKAYHSLRGCPASLKTDF